MPQVSIIIPNYNHAPFLVQRIESVLNQTFQDFEVIILDDCSPDNSREIIEKYRNHPKVVHIEYNTTNSGSTFKQWNKGINLAKGEYIWIAESDEIPGNFLAEGNYRISFAIMTYNPFIIHFHEMDIIGFSVFDTLDGDSVRGTYGGTFPGIIRPNLKWN